jgi:hypothetical protein
MLEILRHIIVSAFRRRSGHIRPLSVEDLPVVSSVGFHAGDKTHKEGVYAKLRSCASSPYGGCGAKQVGPIHKSSERPTNVDCFRELGRVIQWDHGPTCIAAAQELQAAEKDAVDASTKRAADEADASLTANDVLMLHRRLKMSQQRAAEGCCDVSPREPNQPTTSTPYRFSMQWHHVMFFFYVSCCTEALCEEVVQLLVHDMFACAWSRTRIQVLWTESHGGKLYAHQADLLDRRRIYCHSIIRDSES